MKTYQVRAKRWERGWELHIDGVGVTQTRSLAKAEQDIADYLDMLVGEEDREIALIPDLGSEIEARIRGARDALERAVEMQRVAAERSRETVRSLMDRGLPGAEVAAVLKVSPQRVSQLAAEVRSMMKAKAAPKSAGAAVAKRAASTAASRSKNPAKTPSVPKRKAAPKRVAAKKSSKASATAGRRRQP